MTPAFLAGVFSSRLCDIMLYDEVYSGPLEDERILAFPDMLVLTGLNAAFDRMLHITAYVRTKNPNAIVVAGGSAIRALPAYSKNFFDYCCTGDIEQLHEAIEEAFETLHMQNLACAGFLNWHCGHFTGYSPKNKTHSLEDITPTCDNLQDH